MTLPDCGIYRTLAPIGNVPAGRLVYFHNHGNPGAGIYLPARWQNNRAQWQEQGNLLGEPSNANALAPLSPEGFYRVAQAFFCCEKQCRRFEPNLFVQLGYNAAAEPILFTPTLASHGLGLPDAGSRIDPERLTKLERLHVAVSSADAPTNAAHLH